MGSEIVSFVKKWFWQAATLGAVGGLLWLSSHEPPRRVWRSEYYKNARFEGAPVLVGTDDVLDFKWGVKAPLPNLAAVNYSVRWETALNLKEAVEIELVVGSDDGARVILDKTTVLDSWGPHSYREDSKKVMVSPGQHSLVVEFYQIGGDGLLTFKIGVGGDTPDVSAPAGLLRPISPTDQITKVEERQP